MQELSSTLFLWLLEAIGGIVVKEEKLEPIELKEYIGYDTYTENNDLKEKEQKKTQEQAKKDDKSE